MKHVLELKRCSRTSIYPLWCPMKIITLVALRFWVLENDEVKLKYCLNKLPGYLHFVSYYAGPGCLINCCNFNRLLLIASDSCNFPCGKSVLERRSYVSSVNFIKHFFLPVCLFWYFKCNVHAQVCGLFSAMFMNSGYSSELRSSSYNCSPSTTFRHCFYLCYCREDRRKWRENVPHVHFPALPPFANSLARNWKPSSEKIETSLPRNENPLARIKVSKKINHCFIKFTHTFAKLTIWDLQLANALKPVGPRSKTWMANGLPYSWCFGTIRQWKSKYKVISGLRILLILIKMHSSAYHVISKCGKINIRPSQ